MKKFFVFRLALVLSLLCGPAAHAGLYADDLSRCLVQSTSSKDKTDLVRWVVVNTTLHPDVSAIAVATAEQRVDTNRQAAQLLERLLTESCRSQSIEALRYEGDIAIQLSFKVLGQVAMQELMSNPLVREGFGEIGKYVDRQKIGELNPKTR